MLGFSVQCDVIISPIWTEQHISGLMWDWRICGCMWKWGWAIWQCVSGCQPNSTVRMKRIIFVRPPPRQHTMLYSQGCTQINERRSESLVIEWVLYVYTQIFKKQKTGQQPHFIYLTTWHLQRSKVQHYHRSSTNHSWHSYCHPWKITGCEEMMSLTTRQKRADNCVKKCQIWPLYRWAHSRLGSPVQICTGLSPTAVHHTVSPGSGSVSHRLLQVLCLFTPDALPSSFLQISARVELSGQQRLSPPAIWESEILSLNGSHSVKVTAADKIPHSVPNTGTNKSTEPHFSCDCLEGRFGGI